MPISIRHFTPLGLFKPNGYSQVVETQTTSLAFISGQAAVDSEGEIVGRGDFTTQAEQVFRNLSLALQGAGCTASHLVKMTVLLCASEHLPSYRKARDRFFATVDPPAAPAITLFCVGALYEPGLLIEIEAIVALSVADGR